MKFKNLIFLCVSAFIFFSSSAFAATSAFEVMDIEFEGLGKTKESVIVDILPRSLPTKMTQAEITEFSRRVKNLGIFDFVQVSNQSNKLLVKTKRKKTLSPIVDFSSGKTLEDSSFTLGFNEYDFLGTATRIGGKLSYAERGLNFTLWIEEHLYSPNRTAKEIEIYGLSSSFRFEDTDATWSRYRLGGFFEWILPFNYGSSFLYEFQLLYYNESYQDQENTIVGDLNRDHYIGGLFEIIYDRYRWDDLNPSGFKGVVEFRPGFMLEGDFRGEVRLKFLSAKQITPRTTLIANGKLAAVNSGDVNHSLLVGSQEGVRGLSDSLYRSNAVGYANLEIRHAFKLRERLYLQPIGFVDVARFQPMNKDGESQAWENAISTGIGVRIVPTALTNFLFRADLARLHTPSDEWLLLVGITQYF